MNGAHTRLCPHALLSPTGRPTARPANILRRSHPCCPSIPKRSPSIRQIAGHLSHWRLALFVETSGSGLPSKVDVSHRKRIGARRSGNVESHQLESSAIQVRRTLRRRPAKTASGYSIVLRPESSRSWAGGKTQGLVISVIWSGCPPLSTTDEAC
jgi:hypothetical protein